VSGDLQRSALKRAGRLPGDEHRWPHRTSDKGLWGKAIEQVERGGAIICPYRCAAWCEKRVAGWCEGVRWPPGISEA